MPVISIIIPFYNVRSDAFSKCIDSILAQTFEDYEVIIVNDGSAEEYVGLLKNTCSRDERIILITQGNRGVSVARNEGTKRARGEYIVYVDADDYISSRFLTEAYAIVQETSADIIYSFVPTDRKTLDNFCPNQRVQYEKADAAWIQKYTVGNMYKNENHMFGRGPWARLINAEIAKETPFISGVPLGEDVLWNLEILSKTNNRIIAHKTWYCYTDQEYSATRKFDPNIDQRIIPFYSNMKRLIYEKKVPYRLYCYRLFRDLKIYPYKCNYGHKENNNSFFRRWAGFEKTINKRTWKEIKSRQFWNEMDYRGKCKVILVKIHILFLVWTITSMFRQER